MNKVAHRLAGLANRRRFMLSVVLGGLSALAMPPSSLWPVLFIAMPAVVWSLDGIAMRTKRRLSAMGSAFATGWAFGFGYFAVGLYWIAAAFLVDPAHYAWMIPFVVTALPAGLALFWGGGLALAMASWSSGASRLYILAADLTLAEWLRGHILTGFPWNTLGYAVSSLDCLSQLAAYIGLYGLSFLVIFVAASPTIVTDGGPGKRRWPSLAIAVFLALGGWIVGARRLNAAQHNAACNTPRVRIVQPNIAERDKENPYLRRAIFERMLALSAKRTAQAPGGLLDVDILVWPESALPFFVKEKPEALKAIAALLPAGTILVTGALRREASNSGRIHVFNSILVIDSTGEVTGHYDKRHLVPFGEYLPLAHWLEPLGLHQLVSVMPGFSKGQTPAPLNLGGTSLVRALICYEAIFPHPSGKTGARLDWLVNVTNDAWFGPSAGPYQHFAQVRLRAIEEGLALVRAANTGISAIIDPYGRIVSRLDLGEAGIIDGPVPCPLELTLYSRFGGYIPLLLVIGIVTTILSFNRRYFHFIIEKYTED
ncbi:MAG: apolipoprotein N-acyltransferase [Hyphomicrobiales bacterium]